VAAAEATELNVWILPEPIDPKDGITAGQVTTFLDLQLSSWNIHVGWPATPPSHVHRQHVLRLRSSRPVNAPLRLSRAGRPVLV